MKIVRKDTNTLMHVNWLFKGIKFTHFSQIYAAEKFLMKTLMLLIKYMNFLTLSIFPVKHQSFNNDTFFWNLK